jgi:predicted ATPase
MSSVLARHDALLKEIVAADGGVVFKTVGDSVLAAFATAPNALAAACKVQQAFGTEPWALPEPPQIRMALHTGSAELRGGDYFGPVLNRTARLLDAGHGGQVLLSLATEQLVREQLPPDTALRDPGTHRLIDLSLPEQIFQLLAPDLPATFPPLNTIDARHTNLPAQPTPLIGRENEVAAVATLLGGSDVRLLTLTGPGGVGKTRLSLQIAAELIEDFTDGVYFVDLAPIRESSLVTSAIAATLGVRESAGQPLLAALKDYLRDKCMVLLLDNFEHLLNAAPLVADLLATAPRLKILVTSREILHLRGEKEMVVQPLALPDPARLPAFEQLSQYAAVALFIERALDARPGFQVTNANAPAVAEICAHLDGLPLAIELAAARIKLFGPEALLARLGQRLPFLTGGARDLPLRQQTLRNTIDWSYNLLDAAEQALFRRLGVFVGGCTLEAAQAVCNVEGDLPLEMVDGLAALIDKSLVKHSEGIDGEPRFTMLETVRDYAQEHLAASGELEVLRQRHAAFFVTLAEAGVSHDRLEIEHPNLRAALVWSRTEADGTTGLRLVVALDWFWRVSGSLSEGRGWLTDALAPRADRSAWPDTTAYRSLRAKALSRLGDQAAWQNDMAAAQLAIEGSLALFQELGDTWSVADTLSGLGNVVLFRGDYERSGALLEESLALFRQLEDSGSIAMCFFFMGNLAYAQGNLRRAGERYQECLSLFRQLDATWMIANLLLHLGIVALDEGDDERAGAYLAESVTLLRELGERWLAVQALEVYAGLAAARGAGRADAAGVGRWAVRLFGAAEALRETIGTSIHSIYQAHYQRGVAAARVLLDDATFAAAWAEGRTMTLEQAIAEALEVTNDRPIKPTEGS